MRNLERAKKKLDKIATEVGKRKIYYRTFIAMLNREFKSMSIKFSTRPVSKFGAWITVEALYHGEVREDSQWLYTVHIIKDPEVQWVKPRRHGIFAELELVLAHEFRHAYQRRVRKNKRILRENPRFKHFNKHVQKDVRYLIEYDELDAYAFEAALELKMNDWPFTDLQKTAVYRTMYGKKVKRYAPKHFKRWARKVYQHLNKKTTKAGKSA